jgi:DNA-binding XRE family transcriptional regulator
MLKPANFQTILGKDGKPFFVVVPYAEFVKLFDAHADSIPDEVAQFALQAGSHPAKAWRFHLRLTQAEVAKRMGITQSAYAQLEASVNMRKSSRAKIAAALGITAKQLDF